MCNQSRQCLYQHNLHRAQSRRGAIHGARELDAVDSSLPTEALTPDARDVLAALFHALEDPASESRVIVTTRYRFPAPAPGRLFDQGLLSMRGAELQKKCDLLQAWQEGSKVEADARQDAVHVSGGNPRLLEWLDKVLAAYVGAQAQGIMAAMQAKAAEFREDVLAEQLITREGEPMRRLLALWTLPALPVPEAAFRALAGDADFGDALRACAEGGVETLGLSQFSAASPPKTGLSSVGGGLFAHALTRAVSLGLVETGLDEETQQPLYHVSDTLDRLTESAVTPADREQAAYRAAEMLHQLWWVRPETWREDRAWETLRLAVEGRHLEVAAGVGSAISAAMYSGSRFRESATVAALALSVGEDYRLLHSLARAEEVLGDASAALTHYRRALAVCPAGDDLPTAVLRERAAILHNTAGIHAQRGGIDQALTLYRQSLDIHEQIGDARGKAATLHAMAGIHAQRGEIDQALALYHECLKVEDRVGILDGKAATLHQTAGIHAQRGEIDQALTLYRQSLDIHEQIGDARGKAVTLANMGSVAWKGGDRALAERYDAEAVSIHVSVGAWPDAVAVTSNMAENDPTRGWRFNAQALWLALRVEAALKVTILTAAYLQRDLADDHPAAPLLATTAMYLVTSRGEKHVEREELQGLAAGMLGACARARGIAAEDFPAWVERERLNDPDYFLPALSRALEEMVGEDEWLFERSQVPRPEWDA